MTRLYVDEYLAIRIENTSTNQFSDRSLDENGVKKT